MAINKIQLTTVLNLDDSQFKSGISGVETMLKKLSTANAFVKLKLDDKDFRREYQAVVKETIESVRRSFGAKKGEPITYKNAKGRNVAIDTIGSMKSAYTYALGQSVNGNLSAQEKGIWKKRSDALAVYLNVLKQVGQETKNVAKAERELREMPLRKERARRSAEVYLERRNAIKEATAPEKAAKEAAKAERAREDAARRVVKAYQQQYGILGGIGGRLRSYLSVYVVAAFGKKVAETTGYFEKQQVALEGILGSASKAQNVLSQIKSFALQSPFQTKELVTFTKQLSAFSIPADELFETTKKLADISAGLGVNMGRIILAYGQVKAASVLRGQELRQFTEAGIPLVDKLREKFEKLRGEVVTNADVFEMISKRQVSFEMVASVLSDMTEEGGKFFKMQENITNTLYGQMQKLQDMWTIEMDRLGKESGNFLMGVVKLLQAIIQYSKGAAAGLTAAFALDWAIRNVRRMRMEWSLLTVEQQKSIGSLKRFRMLRLAEFGKNIGWGVAAAGVGVAIGAIVTYYQKLTEVGKKMTEISNSFNKETNKMIGGFDSLVKRLREAKKGTQAYNDAIETLKSNYGEFINVNDETIRTLLEERDATEQNVKSYAKLREELAAAIRMQQQYNELSAQGEMLRSTVSTNSFGNEFWRTGQIGVSERELNLLLADYQREHGSWAGGSWGSIGSLFGVNVRSLAAEEEFRKEFRKVASNATEQLLNREDLGSLSDDQMQQAFADLYVAAFRNQFMNSGKISDEWLRMLSRKLFGKVTGARGWGEFIENKKRQEGGGTDLLSMMIRINHEFDKYNSGDNTGTSVVGKQQWTNKKYIELLGNVVDKEFGRLGGDANILGNLKNTISSVLASNVYDNASVTKVSNSLKAFFDTIEDEERKEVVANATKRFKEGTDQLTDQESKIANRMELDATWSGINRGTVNGVKLQDLIDRYNPAALGEKTVMQAREDIKKEYDELEKDRKSFAKNPDFFKDDIALIDAKMKILKRLGARDLYAINFDEKKGGGSGGGWRRMFGDLFNYIKEARAEEKKLVEFSAGTTKALEEQIKSGQLEGTPVAAFWSEGSPFQKIIDKIGEYGLESDVFSQDFIKNELSKIITKSLESTGTVDFQDVWNQLLKIMSDRADKLGGTVGKAIKEFLQGKTVEGEKLFGGDKVEALIKEQLGEITRINANVEKIRSERDMFERIAKSSNYLTAQNAIYGGGQYQRYNAIDTTSNALMTLLRGKAGAGVNYAVPGLLQLLEGGNLSISNLGAIMGIREQLRNKTYADMQGSTDAERQANFENFKGVINQFDSLLKKLTEDIAAEFEQLMALRGPVTRATDDIVNALRDYKDALELIAISTHSGKISGGEADEMYIQALQKLYGATAKGMGGNGLPDFINLLYGASGTAGVSQAGFGLGMWLGNGSLAERYANYEASKIDRSKLSDEEYQEAIEKATKQVMEFAAKMQLAGAIIQKVDGYIQSAGKFANSLINALEATNGLTTDEYGNYTYENDYSTAKEAIKTISEFSSGISSAFQSFMTGDIFGGIMNLGSAIADFFANLFGLGDSQIQKQQDKLISSNKALDRSLNNLSHEINGLAGSDKWDNLTEQMALLRSEEANYRELANLEVKKKHGDAEKAEDYRSNEDAKAKEIEDLIRGIQEEVLGTADEIAQTLTDAFVEAFKNGENAARSWRDTVRTYIGDVLKNALLEKVLAPQLDKILDSFGIKEGSTDSKTLLALLSDPARMTEMRNQLFGAGDAFTDFFNNLDPAIREMIGWNNNTTELSGGIQSITEDTARTLEGLANSMLAQLIMIQRSVMAVETSGFAQVQTSWFNDLLNQQRAIRQATDSINTILGNSRDGVRSLQVRIE